MTDGVEVLVGVVWRNTDFNEEAYNWREAIDGGVIGSIFATNSIGRVDVCFIFVVETVAYVTGPFFAASQRVSAIVLLPFILTPLISAPLSKSTYKASSCPFLTAIIMACSELERGKTSGFC